MFRFDGRGAVDVADALSNDAQGGLISRWINGVLFAVIPTVIGAMCIAYQHAYFLSRRGGMAEYFEKDAIALGVAWIAVGLFMHGHYFWSASRRFYFLSEIFKPLSLLGVAGGMIYVLVNQVVFR